MNIKDHFFKFNIIAFILLFMSCNSLVEFGVRKNDLKKDVEFVTNYGTIIMRLSDETPKHRNNFIKLVNQKFYDSLLFHRVIENFVIQTGDPESKSKDSDKELGASDLPYRIPAEFNRSLFHKRGALNAAREGDDMNPDRASSSTQFTIIQGKTYNDSTLSIAKGRINKWLAYNDVINDPNQKENLKILQSIISNEHNEDQADYEAMKTYFDSIAEASLQTMNSYSYPEAHRNIYKTLGGAAHLDQNYTVFGEVVKGMDVVDKIASMQTNDRNVPVQDIRIISASLIPRKEYK